MSSTDQQQEPPASPPASPTAITTTNVPTAEPQPQAQPQDQQPPVAAPTETSTTTTTNNDTASAPPAEAEKKTEESKPAQQAEAAPAPAPTPAPAPKPQTPAPQQQQQQQQFTAPAPPAIAKPKSVAAARTEGAKLLAKCNELGRTLEVEPGYTGVAAFKKQRENLAQQSATAVSTLANLKAALDTARWQRLQYGSLTNTMATHVNDVRDRVEDEEARVASNPIDKAKNIAASRSHLLRELTMRKEIFSISAKWANPVVASDNNKKESSQPSSGAEQSASSSSSTTNNGGEVSIRTAELELAIKYAEDWPSFVQKARSTLQTVDSDSHHLGGAEGSVPAAEQGLLHQCDELMKQHGVAWLREGQRRKNYGASLKAFVADHAKLMQWCRQRLATLSGLTQPEHIQEFCASFRNSTNVMGANLLVLLESSAALIPNKDVERALLDISETWLGLETFAYERLRTTLLEQHAKSGLEAESRLWPDYSKKLINSLAEAQRLLAETNDASTAKLLGNLREACAQLIQDHDAHLLIVEHLADFSVREECLSDHYRALRAMIFSRITMLCQTFAGLSFPRRPEYSDCVAEASAWVDSKTKSDAWQDMLERVEHIRVIIEKSDSSGEN